MMPTVLVIGLAVALAVSGCTMRSSRDGTGSSPGANAAREERDSGDRDFRGGHEEQERRTR